jgi:tetratricopeptide (TPR) repeat protein
VIRIHYVPPALTTPLVEPQGFDQSGSGSAPQLPWVVEQATFAQGRRSKLDLDHVGIRGRFHRNEKDALSLSREWQELAGRSGKHEGLFRQLHDATCRLGANGKPDLDAVKAARRRLRQWFYQQLDLDARTGPIKTQVQQIDETLGRLVRRNTTLGEAPDDDGARDAKPGQEGHAVGKRLMEWMLPTRRDARANHREALKLWTAGQTSAALDFMEAAADKAPRDWEIQRDLGRMLSDEGYYNEAEWALLTASGLRPRDADLHMDLGELYAQQGLTQMAIESFKAAIVRNPNLTDAYAQLGVALYEDGRPGEAAPHLQKAVSLDQHCVVARFYLAQVMLQQNDLLRARFQLGMVAQQAPEVDLRRFGSSELASLSAGMPRPAGTVYHWKLPGRP